MLEGTRLRTDASQRLWRLAAWLSLLPLLAAGYSSAAPDSPSGAPRWEQIWSDDFNGQAGGGLNTGYWGFDTGRGVFGTGEIETMTSSRDNARLDGHGNLDLVVIGHGTARPAAAARPGPRPGSRPRACAGRQPADR